MITLEIRTPEKALFMGRVQRLSVRAVDGSLGVLPGHAPLATQLAPGTVNYQKENGEMEKMETGAGFLTVSKDQVYILVS